MDQKIRQVKDVCIGSNLKHLRIDAGLTQEQVVAQMQLRDISISRSIYSQIEAGTYNVRVSELKALVDIFRTDFNTVFKTYDNK